MPNASNCGINAERFKALNQPLEDRLTQLNENLPRAEGEVTALQVNDLTVEADELTPSMKLKRKVVADKYKHHLDAHYTS